ncbi:MAG: PAS domain S-box-containing protein, partial [Myxococcota bacterium]
MTPPLFSIALLLAGCIGLLFLVGLPGLSILLACTSCVAVAGWDVLVRSRRPSPAALRESADRLRAIIEAEPECVKTVARDGGLLQMNPAGLRLIQADDFQSVYLANIFDLIHPDSRDAYRELHEAVLRGESRSLQFKLIGLKGAHRWMETTAVPFRGDDGEFIHLAITRDISEWKRREEELAAAWEAAEAAARAKGTFLANMSHEIRTPLTAILGYTEIARSDPGSARAKHAIDVIKFSGEHLNALLSDVLDLSKIEFGELAIEEIPTSISETLRDVHLLHAQSAADKGLTFEVIEEETLPPVVITDPVRLRQILINLVSNAVKFTERGHICVRARSEPCTGDQARL